MLLCELSDVGGEAEDEGVDGWGWEDGPAHEGVETS